ncbi:MAG: zinc ribbon domain-containing protein [Calditrichaeota bacterium]|nr:MAG: zinc ribbon domain-containing protein [Calditrichota bacterium]
MPINEYVCRKCGHRFDVLQRLGEDGSQLNCPHCNEPKPEKMISAFSACGVDSPSHSDGGRGCSSGFG